MSSHEQTQEELATHLREQVAFLARSAEAFDSGHVDEAKRMAAVLRVLLHDTQQSISLLSQLGCKGELRFYDSASPFNPHNLAGEFCLCVMHVVVQHSPETTAQFVPRLDDHPSDEGACTRTFDDWWGREVISDKHGRSFTRKDLVLGLANKDGGAHIAPQLNESYAALSRHYAPGWNFVDGDLKIDVPSPHLASVRQIAHEVITTLGRVLPEQRAAEEYAAAHSAVDPENLPFRVPAVGRNERCPCGSGKKYKRCHGAP